MKIASQSLAMTNLLYNKNMNLQDLSRKLIYYLDHLRLSVWLSICFIGFAIGTTVGFGFGKGAVIFVILCFLCCCVLIICWRRHLARFACLAFLFFITGGIRAITALPVERLDSWSEFEGIISGFPARVSESGYQYRVSVVDSRLIISVNSSNRAEYGDKIRVSCRLSSLQDPSDFQFWQLRSKDITAECGRDASLEIIEKKSQKFFASLAAVKNTSRKLLESSLPEPESSLALGIILGERGERTSALNSAMRKVGLSHISVVSGYNVLVVAQGIFFLFFFFKLKRLPAFLGTVLALLLFLLFIGFDASIIRAVIMFIALQIVYFLGRPRLGFYVICLTSFVMLLLNPFLIRNVGFLLSFASVAGMSLTAGFWGEVVNKLPDVVKPFVVSTLSAQTGALPLVIWYFGTVSILSLLVNVIVLPLIPFAMGASFATILLSLTGFSFAGWISYPLLTTVVHVAEWFSKVPFVQVMIPGQFGRVVLLAILALIYITIAERQRWLPLLKSRFQEPESVLKEEEVREIVIE